MTPAVTIPKLCAHLALIQDCFPESTSIIAGGAVRDTLLGKPVKDIDVFIDLAEDPGRAVDKLCERLYCTEGVKWAGEGDYLSASGYGKREPRGRGGAFLVCDIPKGIGDCPTQLIFLSLDPVENLKATFDFDISQAWVTRHRVWTSSLCRAAMVNRMITYCPRETPNEQQKTSSRARLARLREKYTGWHFRGIV